MNNATCTCAAYGPDSCPACGPEYRIRKFRFEVRSNNHNATKRPETAQGSAIVDRIDVGVILNKKIDPGSIQGH